MQDFDNKPLPNPFHQNVRNEIHRPQSTRQPRTATQDRPHRRLSLSDGLNTYRHDGEAIQGRYPKFPKIGQIHMHRSSKTPLIFNCRSLSSFISLIRLKSTYHKGKIYRLVTGEHDEHLRFS